MRQIQYTGLNNVRNQAARNEIDVRSTVILPCRFSLFQNTRGGNLGLTVVMLVSICFAAIDANSQEVSVQKISGDPKFQRNQLMIELDHKIDVQSIKDRDLKQKGEQLARELNASFADVENRRNEIRDALRIRVYKEVNTFSNGNSSGGTSRYMFDMPSAASLLFEKKQEGELKNLQGRMRAKRASYQRLVRQFLEEAAKQDRLELLRDRVADGRELSSADLEFSEPVKREAKQNFTHTEPDIKPIHNAIGLETLKGQPNSGDLVAARSKPIFVLKERRTALELAKRPTSFRIQTLERMVAEGNAAKLTPTSLAVVQMIDDEMSLVRIKFEHQEDGHINFIGWVGGNLLTRVRKTSQ